MTASLVEAHHSELNALLRLARRDLGLVWDQVDTPDAARQALMDLLPQLAQLYGSAAATLGADWYDEMRAAAGVIGGFRAVPAELPDKGRTDALARWGIGPLFKTEPDFTSAKTLIEGGFQRIVADASRNTVLGSAASDPASGRWQRVGTPECDFCRMLIGRGAVYRTSRTADFQSHDHCDCMAVPLFGKASGTQQVEKTQLKLNNLAKPLDPDALVGKVEKTQLKLVNLAQPQKTQIKLNNLAGKTQIKLNNLAGKPASAIPKTTPKSNNLDAFHAKLKAATQAKSKPANAPTSAVVKPQQVAAARVAAAEVERTETVRREVREFARQDEGRRYGASTWAGPEGYTRPQLNALRDYTGDGYRRINDRLRSSRGTKLNPVIRQIDAAMDRAPRVPEDVRVVRNVRADAFGLPPGSDLSKLVGKSFTEHAYLSTSLNSKGAMSGDVRINLVVPQGHKAVYVSGKPPQGAGNTISTVGGGEAELLLQRGTTYRVLGVRRTNARWIVDAEVLPVAA